MLWFFFVAALSLERVITVYAVKKKGGITFFLIYNRGRGQWEWDDADNYIPVEQ